MKTLPVCLLCLALSACGGLIPRTPEAPSAGAPVSGTQVRPLARPAQLDATPAKAPPATARTAEQFDTTSRADRAQAAAAPADPAAERALGTTVASLGDPARPGFWLETPLVSAPSKGRVEFPGTGKSSQVDLIPVDGPKTAGSRISLAAMRLIGAPLTGLPELRVFAGG